jgi:hypothetical protein
MKKTYKIEVIEDENGFKLNREVEGFNPLELLGLLEMTQMDILKQMAGDVKPDKISRVVISG